MIAVSQNLPGTGYIAGVDEVGRGCLAGPVVACAVILLEQAPPGVTDSKALRPQQRAILEPLIKKCCHFGLGVVWQKRIDAINILQATFEAMSKALCSLPLPPAHVLIDGNKTIPQHMLAPRWQTRFDVALPLQKSIVKGDSTNTAIAAASILAKTFRDRLMQHLAKRWPEYGFEQHVGYGTKRHLTALRQFGPCPLHRLTFRGVLPETPMVQGHLC